MSQTKMCKQKLIEHKIEQHICKTYVNLINNYPCLCCSHITNNRRRMISCLCYLRISQKLFFSL
jgi:hypothetical protein